jgi:hypothetical protein
MYCGFRYNISKCNSYLLLAAGGDLKASNGKYHLRILNVDDDSSLQEISKQIIMDIDGSFEIDHVYCIDEELKKLAEAHYE